MLDNKKAAEESFSQFERALFPEKEAREKAHDELSQKVLEGVGEDPIAVEPAAPIGSVWGNRFRNVRVGVRSRRGHEEG